MTPCLFQPLHGPLLGNRVIDVMQIGLFAARKGEISAEGPGWPHCASLPLCFLQWLADGLGSQATQLGRRTEKHVARSHGMTRGFKISFQQISHVDNWKTGLHH